jgi:hypothetical protein
MRTFLLIVGGLATLGGSLLAARWYGAGWRVPIADVGKFFIAVTQCGRICIGRRKINLSQVFAGQNVGIKEIAEKIWLVSFMHYDLGFFDYEAGRAECAPNPFSAKVSTMSPV